MHVDLVKNDWNLNVQVCLGQVELADDSLVIREVVPEYKDVVAEALERVAGIVGGERQLRALGQKVNGTNLFFSAPHADPECPFVSSPSIPMDVVDFVALPG